MQKQIQLTVALKGRSATRMDNMKTICLIMAASASVAMGQAVPVDLLPDPNEPAPLVLESPATTKPPLEVKPEQGGASIGYTMFQSPAGYSWGEWVTALIMGSLATDQVLNNGDVTRDFLDDVRGKSDDHEDRTTDDRDFITATSESCTAAAKHSKDIELIRSGATGSCEAKIFTPEE